MPAARERGGIYHTVGAIDSSKGEATYTCTGNLSQQQRRGYIPEVVVGAMVREAAVVGVGGAMGADVGAKVKEVVSEDVGPTVGDAVGAELGPMVGEAVGADVCAGVAEAVGEDVGA
jgi:hypothetical protein